MIPELIGNTTEEKIWNYLYTNIGNAYGVAGIMGNMYAESALNSISVQKTYREKVGSNEDYTHNVDRGVYTNFVNDKIGYGLVQWTHPSLKQHLYNYAINNNVSIGNLAMQLACFMDELKTSYSQVLRICKEAKTIREASDTMLLKFERPANKGENVQQKRAEYGQVYFDKFASIPKDTKVNSAVGKQTMKYNDANSPLTCMMTNSSNYKGTDKMKIVGVLWHSTGANNPYLKRYVQPDDSSTDKKEILFKLGINTLKNDYNHTVKNKGVNAWIGKLNDGTVETLQVMPWDYRPWGCGSGSKGSCNAGWIQFEICEDGLTNKSYFDAVYQEACELTAYLCKKYNIDPNGSVIVNGVKIPTILCHADSYALGFGSRHSDVNHWFQKFGKSMDTVREHVTKLMSINVEPSIITKTVTAQSDCTKCVFAVKVKVSSLNYRSGPGMNYNVNGIIQDMGTYTIVETEKDTNGNLWGKLKSGVGWINLFYTSY